MSKARTNSCDLLNDMINWYEKKLRRAKMDGGPKEINSANLPKSKIFSFNEIMSDLCCKKIWKRTIILHLSNMGDESTVGEDLVKLVAPIREKAMAIRNDPAIWKRCSKKSGQSKEKCQRYNGTGKKRDGVELLIVPGLKWFKLDWKDNFIFYLSITWLVATSVFTLTRIIMRKHTKPKLIASQAIWCRKTTLTEKLSKIKMDTEFWELTIILTSWIFRGHAPLEF